VQDIVEKCKTNTFAQTKMVITENCKTTQRRIWALQFLQQSVSLFVNVTFKKNLDAVVEKQMVIVGGTQNQRQLAVGQTLTLPHYVQQL
jgi:ABC-type lipopolysaccharide export system ATPase subunit